jgi:hypothetical protein
VLRFQFTDETGPSPTCWHVADPGHSIGMCVLVPDFDIDLHVACTKLSLKAISMGRTSLAREIVAGRLFVTGDAILVRTMDQWLPRTIHADVEGVRLLPVSGQAACRPSFQLAGFPVCGAHL